ncbi:Uncharacterised protein [Achromobacter sp. 2789STDY5608621]|nr:Uncharacterised protein [Achromobacter sp. 2789STDY5608621]
MKDGPELKAMVRSGSTSPIAWRQPSEARRRAGAPAISVSSLPRRPTVVVVMSLLSLPADSAADPPFSEKPPMRCLIQAAPTNGSTVARGDTGMA